jgi:hypothetical protein
MKTIKKVAFLALASVAIIAGCKKDSPRPSPAPLQTIPVQSTQQSMVPMGDASTFAVLAGAAVTNGGTTTVTGDLGLSPGTSVTGFPPGILVGTQHINDALAYQAKTDLATAYNNAADRTCIDMVNISGNIGGLTLTPGLYRSTSSVGISYGDLTFDALGDPNAVFIIQVGTSLNIASGRKVILTGGAVASNIFWQVGSSATFGTSSVFKGTVMAMQSLMFDSSASLDGRALSRSGTVSMEVNSIVKQ